MYVYFLWRQIVGDGILDINHFVSEDVCGSDCSTLLHYHCFNI